MVDDFEIILDQALENLLALDDASLDERLSASSGGDVERLLVGS